MYIIYFFEWGIELSFFKFVNEERIDILQNGCIRFTPPADFNDPFEFKPNISKFHRRSLQFEFDRNALSEDDLIEKYPKIQKFNENDESLIQEYSNTRNDAYTEYKRKLDQILVDYGVLSVFSNKSESLNPSMYVHDESEPRQNILMWSHYANNHKGMVIEFNQSFFSDEIEEVTYVTKRPTVTYEEIDNLCSDNLSKIFNSKKNVWNNESEFRVVKKLTDADNIIRENIHLFNFNKRSIRSVTIGCKADPKFADKVYEILKSDPELNHVAFYESQIHHEEYQLKFFQRIEQFGRTFTNKPLFEDMDVTSKIPSQLPIEYLD